MNKCVQFHLEQRPSSSNKCSMDCHLVSQTLLDINKSEFIRNKNVFFYLLFVVYFIIFSCSAVEPFTNIQQEFYLNG